MKNLAEYFEQAKGRGILATADGEGKVDAAVYARPHFTAADELAFIMADRLTHHNLQQNPKAAYLFMEDGEQYRGRRLFLTKIKESEDPAVIESMLRRGCCDYCADDSKPQGKRFAVYFKLDQVRPLVGSGE